MYKNLILRLLICLVLVFSGCSTTTIIDHYVPVAPNDESKGYIITDEYIVKSKANSIVTVKKADGTEVIVNNQGKSSAFEWFMVHLLSNTEIQVGDENDSE